MTERGQRSIRNIRTFNDDVSRARSTSAPTPLAQTDSLPSPTPVVATPPTPVPLASREHDAPPPIPAPAPLPVSQPTIISAAPVATPNSETTISGDVDLAATITTLGVAGSQASPLSSDDIDDPLATEGTIVSDKRRKRFKLLPAIGTAVSDWADEAKSNLTKQEAGATITTVESRLDTLKAAAKASHQVPHDDHGVIMKRLAETPRENIAPTTNIKAASATAAPTWKHISESTAETETEDANPVLAPEPTPASSPTSKSEPTLVSAPAEHQVVRTAEVLPQREATAPRTSAPDAGYAAYRPTTSPIMAATPRMAVAKPIMQPAAVAPAPILETAAYRVPTEAPSVQPTPTQPRMGSKRTLVMFTAIIIGASLLGVGTTALWYIGTRATSEVTTAPVAPSIIATNVRTPVAIAADRTATLNALLDATLQNAETQHIYLTGVTTDGKVVPAEAAEVFTALSFRLPGNFSRSVRSINFGSYQGTHPFIVMHTSDFSTAFAGMLAWEPALSADLVPLFGNAVNESFDPTARTASQIRSAFFRDTVIANVSARVLVDASNEERIVYGFVKPNVLLIAPNEATFAAIAPLIIETP